MLGAHARPDRDAHHGGQGARQRRGAPRAPARRARRGRGARQDEWRGRQFQRPRRRAAGASTGRRSAPASSARSASRRTRYTTQIEPHDWIAEYCHALLRANTVLLDFCRDMWSYISLGYFRQKPVRRRGRLLHHAAQGQPDRLRERGGQSRPRQCTARALRREAAGVPAAARPHATRPCCAISASPSATAVLAYQSLEAGASQGSSSTRPASSEDLSRAWEVLGEAVQTVMRAHGMPDAYDRLKDFTRGRPVDEAAMREFIALAAAAGRGKGAAAGARARKLPRARAGAGPAAAALSGPRGPASHVET